MSSTQIPCKPLGQGYFQPKVVQIIPETCILNVMKKKSGGENDSQKCPYNH